MLNWVVLVMFIESVSGLVLLFRLIGLNVRLLFIGVVRLLLVLKVSDCVLVLLLFMYRCVF